MRLTKRVTRFGRPPRSSRSIGETCARHLPVLSPSHQSARALPKLGAYESTVRAWLTEDLKVPKKQRHSATRIWQRLIDECGTFGRNTQLLFLAEDPVGNRSQPSHSPQTFPRAYQYHTQPFRVSPKARELRLSAVVRSQALRLASPTLGCINSVPCGVGGPRRGYPVEFT